MIRTPNQPPTRLGFRLQRSSTHTSRTMMLEELRGVLSYVARSEAGKVDYRRAIDDENCLGKQSSKTRLLTYRHLSDLYALEPSQLLFRTLVYFWQRVPCGQPLLALLCAYASDSTLCSTAPFICAIPGRDHDHSRGPGSLYRGTENDLMLSIWLYVFFFRLNF